MLKILRTDFLCNLPAKAILPLVIAFFLFSSCGSYEQIDFGKVNDFRVNEMSGGKMQLVLNVTIDNPNKFTIKVVKSELDLEIGGNSAGKITLGEKVKIKKKKEQNYDIVVEADSGEVTAAVMKTALSSLTSKKVKIKVKGWVKGRVFIFGKKENVEFKHDIDLDNLKK
ncbi:MAG: LEA type 2 family protein [Bacteroidota bacterium]